MLPSVKFIIKMKMLTNMLIVIIIVTVGLCDENIEVKKIQTRGIYGFGRPDDRLPPQPPRDNNHPNDLLISKGPPRPGDYHNSPHNHDHHFHGGHPDFHHNHHGDDVKTWGKTDEPVNFSNMNSTGIPLDLAMSLNEYSSISELLYNEVEGAEQKVQVASFANRFGSDGDALDTERSAARIATPAKCQPELTTVKIAESNDPNVLYVPECTRIERCGGCCSHALLSCQATEFENVQFSVLKTEYSSSENPHKKLKYVGKEPISIQKHTKCKCMCKIKAKDCNAYQDYRESECRCICKNTDEEQKCYRNSNKKLWNPDECACQCREVTLCSTGYNFDYNECRCVQIQFKRRYILAEIQKEQPQKPED
ncbi:uncharacterized protein LOC126738175 [Anthonomus grandis grandis]|uniref:uncharacterized protein LOC126738175 n=1 Tax=Anthonomus grandis grandis TaxID=2921223 RepID=UPI0021657FA0|nr:uncharacterized protein LOC126738175 [Anthonomus grandis grandis]